MSGTCHAVSGFVTAATHLDPSAHPKDQVAGGSSEERETRGVNKGERTCGTATTARGASGRRSSRRNKAHEDTYVCVPNVAVWRAGTDAKENAMAKYMPNTTGAMKHQVYLPCGPGECVWATSLQPPPWPSCCPTGLTRGVSQDGCGGTFMGVGGSRPGPARVAGGRGDGRAVVRGGSEGACGWPLMSSDEQTRQRSTDTAWVHEHLGRHHMLLTAGRLWTTPSACKCLHGGPCQGTFCGATVLAAPRCESSYIRDITSNMLFKCLYFMN